MRSASGTAAASEPARGAAAVAAVAPSLGLARADAQLASAPATAEAPAAAAADAAWQELKAAHVAATEETAAAGAVRTT